MQVLEVEEDESEWSEDSQSDSEPSRLVGSTMD